MSSQEDHKCTNNAELNKSKEVLDIYETAIENEFSVLIDNEKSYEDQNKKGRQLFGEWRRHILALQSAKDEPILLTVHLLARTCKDCRRQTPNISLL